MANQLGVAWWGTRLGYLKPVEFFFFFLWSIVCSLEPSVISAASSTLWRILAQACSTLCPILRSSAYHPILPTVIGQREKKKRNVTNNIERRQHYTSHVLPWLAANNQEKFCLWLYFCHHLPKVDSIFSLSLTRPGRTHTLIPPRNLPKVYILKQPKSSSDLSG